VGNYRTVLVGTDGSESSYRAVERAAAVAQATGATLVLVSAYGPGTDEGSRRDGGDTYRAAGAIPAEGALRGAAERARAAGAKSIQAVAVEGDPADVLVSIADGVDAELIVVGDRGRSGGTNGRRADMGAGRLLGSVPGAVSHRARCDVLIAHTTDGW
jgi:nucleotide-binding universal stress UspA family protein